MNGNKFATGQILRKPVEVVKGRILAGWAQKSPEPWSGAANTDSNVSLDLENYSLVPRKCIALHLYPAPSVSSYSCGNLKGHFRLWPRVLTMKLSGPWNSIWRPYYGTLKSNFVYSWAFVCTL
jgi:hypothetical protein